MFQRFAKYLFAGTVLGIGAVLATSPATAGAQGFAPLATLKPNQVIVFDGDSITDGGRQRSGSDYNHIMGQDYGYILAAQIGYIYPDRNLTFINRGVGSSEITGMRDRWQSDVLDLKPNMISILIGINDSLGGESVEQYEKIYDKLVEQTLSALPGVKIVIGEPFLLPVGNYEANYLDKLATVKLRANAARRVADKYHLPFVEYQKAFDAACKTVPPSHWSWDGVHPTYAGHELLAAEWIKQVNAAWPN